MNALTLLSEQWVVKFMRNCKISFPCGCLIWIRMGSLCMIPTHTLVTILYWQISLFMSCFTILIRFNEGLFNLYCVNWIALIIGYVWIVTIGVFVSNVSWGIIYCLPCCRYIFKLLLLSLAYGISWYYNSFFLKIELESKTF